MFTLHLLNNFRFRYQTNSNSRGLNSSYKLAVKACSKFVLVSTHQLEHFSSICFSIKRCTSKYILHVKLFTAENMFICLIFQYLAGTLTKSFQKQKLHNFRERQTILKGNASVCVYVCMYVWVGGWVCGCVLVPFVLFMLQFSAERNGK